MASNLGAKISMKVEGLDSLRLALHKLPERVAARALSAAVAGGARVVVKEAKARVREDTGLLKRMLRATRGKRKSWEATAFVTVRRLSRKKIAEFKRKTGKKSSANPLDPFYWAILEFGKSDRTRHPFIRPAFDSKKEEAAKEIGVALDKAIQKEAKKLYGERRK
jgi:HK97 gp10 family phage protein